jgi:superfamily II DNA or RNA helicase
VATSDPATAAYTIRARLASLEVERLRLEDELRALEDARRGLLPLSPESSASGVLQPAEKVALFLSLFGARRSVYPKLWENPKAGKKGYSPACENEWRRGVCAKPKVKCSECRHQKFPPLDASAVEAHLRGAHTVGTYAIREDDSCIFLAADFDEDGWWEEAQAYGQVAANALVPVALERSRSGNGAHAWTFFAEPVPAVLARRLATILLAKTSAARPSMSLRAYDRLFPNQDTMPAGGFGNLIALPLAKVPRQQGNTVFIDEQRRPYADQWAYLASLRRLPRDELDRLLERLAPPAPISTPAADAGAAFSLESDERALDLSCPKIPTSAIQGEVTLRLDAAVHIPRTTLPPALLANLKRLATFANPVFYEKQRLRFPTYDTPRFLFAGEWHPDRLVLPRGVLEEAQRLIEDAGATVIIHDSRPVARRIRWTFSGQLRPEQELAVREMMKHERGVLAAPPGAGKTVMGCALIARHRTATLVLVHRAVLLDQWRQEATSLLGLKKKDIGVWRGKTTTRTGRLDIAMLPSLARHENPAEVFAQYGLVIVDECHHVPAVSFEALLKACTCRHIVGLTATPQRKDGLERLMHLQCGPLRHSLAETREEAVPRVVFVRKSSFQVEPNLGPKPPLHEVWQALVEDPGRTEQIASDIWSSMSEGRSPLVLSDRKAHLEKIEAAVGRLRGAAEVSVFRFSSSDGVKRRREIRAELEARAAEGSRFVIFATAALVGEGFDLPRLDTLFLAMPLSFKGRLIQYAGRLHRAHADKTEIRVYDYLDENHPITLAMFRRRAAAYRQMGYRFAIDESIGGAALRGQQGLFEDSVSAPDRH